MQKKNLKIFILLLFFILSSTLTFILNKNYISLISHINGLRNIIVIFFIYFFNNSILKSKYASLFHNLILKFVAFFIIIQLPVSLIQFIKFGAGDRVAGTFSSSLGGGSGTLTIIIYLISFFLLVNNTLIKKINAVSLKKTFLIIPLLFPSFINETKITFIILPLFFILLLKLRTLRDYFSSIFIIVISFFLFNALNDTYKDTTRYGKSYQEIFTKSYLTRYLYENKSKNKKSPPRLKKIEIGYNIISKNRKTFLFGVGYGIFKGGTVIAKSKRAKSFEWLGAQGPLLYVLSFQGGIIGAFLILLFFILLFRNNSKKPFFIKQFKKFLFAIFLISLLYTHALYGALGMLFIYFTLFCNNYENVIFKNNVYTKKINFIDLFS